MKYCWLNKKNNDKLIVFFNGWAMDENAVKHLDFENYDIVVLYDYNDLNLEADITGYKEKHVIGWSMGVMILTLNRCKKIVQGADSITAIAGTPYLVDDNYGIPEKIYDLTLNGFSEKSAKRFFERMGVDLNLKLTDRNYENQKAELKKLKEYKSENDYNFTKIIIPKCDFIIPTKNQVNYWNGANIMSDNVFEIKAGHYPFLLYNKWSELI